MSYDPSDAAWDEFYDRMSEELYPDHKDQAIAEFTEERLQSFYLRQPNVMRPAVDAIQEGKRLQKNGHHSAALVFFCFSNWGFAESNSSQANCFRLNSQWGFFWNHCKKHAWPIWLQKIWSFTIKNFPRAVRNWPPYSFKGRRINPTLKRVLKYSRQKKQNCPSRWYCTENEAELGRCVAVAVFELIVRKVLCEIGLYVGEHGLINRLNHQINADGN